MEKVQVLKNLTLFAGPIGWAIVGLVYAEDFRRMYCRARKRNRK